MTKIWKSKSFIVLLSRHNLSYCLGIHHLSVSLSLSLFVSDSFSVSPVSLPLSLSLSCPQIYLSTYLPISCPLSLSSPRLSLFLALCLTVSVSCVSLSLCLTLFCVSLSHSVSVSLSPVLNKARVTPHTGLCGLGGTNNSPHAGRTCELAQHFLMLLSPFSRRDPEAQGARSLPEAHSS